MAKEISRRSFLKTGTAAAIGLSVAPGMMAKKKKKELMEQKDKFIYGAPDEGITGCAALGIPAEVAAKIFGDMESFASYAFNKSHAAAYAVVAYRTAY